MIVNHAEGDSGPSHAWAPVREKSTSEHFESVPLNVPLSVPLTGQALHRTMDMFVAQLRGIMGLAPTGGRRISSVVSSHTSAPQSVLQKAGEEGGGVADVLPDGAKFNVSFVPSGDHGVASWERDALLRRLRRVRG